MKKTTKRSLDRPSALPTDTALLEKAHLTRGHPQAKLSKLGNRLRQGLIFLFALYGSTTLSPFPVAAQDAKEIQRQRQEIIDTILTSDEPDLVARRRWICFTGDAPPRVREARAGGFAFTPDAYDSCLASLQRKGKDHALLEAYKKLTTNLQGNPETYDRLPKAIGNAILGGNSIVAVGNGKGVKIDPALAFDAGFTSAYISAAPRKNGLDAQKLKTFAEGCLDQQKDAATCFSVGYALGSRAVNAF